MKEVIKMWKYPNMIAMTAFTSAIYVAFLVPFKSVPLIPGFTEIRPANIFPVILGLLFGPAGAWGSAIGNLVGDMFGTLSVASVFGFIGNFMYAYIPYKLWGKLINTYGEELTPTLDSPKKFVHFGTVTVISSSACAAFIALGCDILGMVPFAKIAAIILLNNIAMTLVLGPILLPLIYRQVKKMGLLWTDVMKADREIKEVPGIYPTLLVTGALGAVAVGFATSLGMSGQSILELGSMMDGAGQIGVILSTLPFLLIMFYGLSKL